MIALGFGVLGLVGMSIYLLNAVAKGLITWSDVPYYQTGVLIGCLPMFAMSYLLCRWRLKKAAELREYERKLATLAEQA